MVTAQVNKLKKKEKRVLDTTGIVVKALRGKTSDGLRHRLSAKDAMKAAAKAKDAAKAPAPPVSTKTKVHNLATHVDKVSSALDDLKKMVSAKFKAFMGGGRL